MAMIDMTRAVERHGRRRAWPRARSSATGWRPAIARRRQADAARPVGRRDRCIWRCSMRRSPRSRCSASLARTAAIPSVGRTASAGDPPGARDPRSVRAGSGRRCRTRGPGSIMAAGMCVIRSATDSAHRSLRHTLSCRWRAKACIRSRSVRCMPASSSPVISASPPMARRGAAGAAARLCAQGHRIADGGRDARARRRSSPGRISGDSTVAYALAFAQRGRGGAGRRGAAARAFVCAR